MDRSRAARSIERIAELLDAIEELGDISTGVEWERFDLSELIFKIVEREEVRLSAGVEVIGPARLPVTGSPALVDLALAKGIENAAESTEIGPNPKSALLLNWGVTDRDAWFVVIDDGVGLAPNIDVFGFAKSDKEGHLGVGLALASEAIKAMSGTLTLEANAGSGATLRATWPIQI